MQKQGNTSLFFLYDTSGIFGFDLIKNGSTSSTHIGIVNPIRYKGYCYDTETGLYYLNSRYYDPAICRFISADGQLPNIGESVLGCNMYAYCMNNAVTLCDKTGEWPELSTVFTSIAIATAAVAITAAVVAVAAVAAPALVVVGGTTIAASSIAATATTIGIQAAATISKREQQAQKRNETFSVYFLGDATGTIRYVGRVTDARFKARMVHHEHTRGLKPVERIAGLDYATARGLEEIGMIEFHTLNAANPAKNHIHGLSPNNMYGERYMEAAYNYLLNRAENTILNLLWSGVSLCLITKTFG